MKISTKRLIIKSVTKKDASYFYKLKYDKYVLKYTPNYLMKDASIDDIKSIIGNTNDVIFSIFLKDTNEFIGSVSYGIHEILFEYQVSWYIKEEYTKNGYASEATIALCDYLFNKKKLSYVIAVMNIDNKASYYTAIKSGFNLFEKRKVYDYHNNKYYDDYYYFRKYNPLSNISNQFYGDAYYDEERKEE